MKLSVSQTKDVLLELISNDIKGLQAAQCDIATHMDVVTSSNVHAQSLCDHLDYILMHKLYQYGSGYWPCVKNFTHNDVVKTIRSLVHVKTDIGRGRSWLNLALNEQVMESYLRIFIENQDILRSYYNRDAFLRDNERLSLLLTLITGLDFVTFDLSMDEQYLDFSASSNTGSDKLALNFNIKPTFIASVTPQVRRRQELTHSDIHIPYHSSPIPSPTSSLPTRLPTDEKRHDSGLYSKESSLTSTNSTNQAFLDSETISSDYLSSSLVNDEATGLSKENVDLENVSVTSFLDRFIQLDDQERKKVKEEEEAFLVARRQRKSKEKKRKKKKNERKIRLGKEEQTDEIMDSSLLDSLKENQPPSITTKLVKSVLPDLTVVPPEELNNSKMVEPEFSSTNPFNEIPVPDETSDTSIDELKLDQSDTNLAVIPSSNLYDDNISSSNNGFDKQYSNSFTGTVHSVSSLEQEKQVINTGMLHDFINGDHVTSINIDDLLDNQDKEIENEAKTGEDLVIQSSNVVLSSLEEFSEQYLLKDDSSDVDIEKMRLNVTGETGKIYDAPPTRPMSITHMDKHSCDIAIDDNTRIVLSLDVFHQPEETAVRLVSVQIPQGPGRYQKACLVITDAAIYLTQADGTEGVYSRILGVSYLKLDHIVIGLSWQSIGLVYTEQGSNIHVCHKQMIITGDEAVSRSIADSINSTASRSKVFGKAIPRNRDDEARIAAIEKELIKLGSETSMELVRYCLVHWEQLSGEPPLLSPPADITVPVSGNLFIKEMSIIKKPAWRMAYFQLLDGVLHHFHNENDKLPKGSYPMRGSSCGGCTRTSGETKAFAFTVIDSNGSSLILAGKDEDDLTKWMQALCMAASGVETIIPHSPIHKGGAFCAVLLTQNKIHVLQEDWSKESVQLVASISVQDVNDISVDKTLPLYCTLTYDDYENEIERGVWMLCFSSEYELGQFERALTGTYKDIFQVDPNFSEMVDPLVKSRAQRAIELTKASKHRSDSITRGRTEFTYEHKS